MMTRGECHTRQLPQLGMTGVRELTGVTVADLAVAVWAEAEDTNCSSAGSLDACSQGWRHTHSSRPGPAVGILVDTDGYRSQRCGPERREGL